MDDNLNNMDLTNNTLRDDNNAMNATIIHQEIVCDEWERSVNEMKQEIENKNKSLGLMESINKEEKNISEKMVRNKDNKINSLNRKLKNKRTQLQIKNQFINNHIKLVLQKDNGPTSVIPRVPQCEDFQLTESASIQTENSNIPEEQYSVEMPVSNVDCMKQLMNSFKVVPETDSD